MLRNLTGKFCHEDGDTCGTYVDEKGYPRISAGPCRGVRVHTLVAEAMLGRKLEKHEDVHHKDENKLNPRWTNLEVIDHRVHGFVSSRQAHAKKMRDAQEKKEWNEAFGPGSIEPDPFTHPLCPF